MKKRIFALSIMAFVAIATVEVSAHGWGRGDSWGHMGGYGHMGNGYGHMGSGYGHMGNGYGRMGYGNNMGYGFSGMSSRYIDSMKYELGLNDKQVEKISKIGSEFREKFFENRGNPEKIESLEIKHRKAIENVLTKKQLEKFENYGSRGGRYGWYGGCYGSNN